MKTPFKCPVCNGCGGTSSSFSGNATSNFDILVPCTACLGRGIVWGSDFEDQTSAASVKSMPVNTIFGKNYLIDCSRISSLPENEQIIERFFLEIHRVIRAGESVNFYFNKAQVENDYSFAFEVSSRSTICARWSSALNDFYLDVFSLLSFDEHLIRQIILNFFDPDMYEDHIVVRKAPFGFGKKFTK